MKKIAKWHLDNVILPFWKKLIDEKRGGYYGRVGYNLDVDYDYEKSCILNSRILWFFSKAYLIHGDVESLAYAEHAYEFLKSMCIDKDNGGLFWSIDSDNNVLDDSKHTYNQAFGIYALSAYYSCRNDKEALKLAYDLFNVIETKCKDKIGYLESFTRDFIPTLNEKLSDSEHLDKGELPPKTMNTVLHVLEAYTEFYIVTKDEKVKIALEYLLELIDNKIYNKKNNRLEVFFDDNYNSVSNIQSFGHDIEAAWLIDRACKSIGEKKYIDKFAVLDTKLVDKVLELSLEKNFIYNEDVDEKVDKTKIWWVQAEAVVSLVNEYQKTGNNQYKETAIKILKFIMEFIVDKRENSEWHWDLDEDNIDSGKRDIAGPWKCPYHNGRMCFELIERDINV